MCYRGHGFRSQIFFTLLPHLFYNPDFAPVKPNNTSIKQYKVVIVILKSTQTRVVVMVNNARRHSYIDFVIVTA